MTATATAPTDVAKLSAAEVTAYLALVQAQAAARRQLTQAAVDAVFLALTGFDDWWDSDKISALVVRILKQVRPAQIRAARLTDAYVARMVSKQRGKTVRPAGAIDVTKLRRRLPQNVIEELARDERDVPFLDIGDTLDGPGDDIDAELEQLLKDGEKSTWREPADVYGRLADKYRWEVIAHGADHETALQKVKVRAEAVVDMDIALAIRKQEGVTAKKLGVKHYRRVLHPELAKSGLSCGLCIVASDRIYTVGKFERELHDHCNCEMIPIDSGKDPALRLNQDDLDSLYAAAGKAVGKDSETGGGAAQLGALKRVRVGITEHGELGPILVKVGTTDDGQLIAKGIADANVGPKSKGTRLAGVRTVKDYAKTQTTSPKLRAEAQLPAMIKSLAALVAKKAAGDPGTDKPIQFHRQRIAELRRIAGE